MAKSYRNANTEMRVHFDEMQAEVEHKVEEAMASFREERLRTQARRPREPEPAPPLASVKRPASRWPWLIGAGGVAMLLVLGGLQVSAPTPSAPLSQPTAMPVLPTAVPTTQPHRASRRATPVPTLAPTIAPPADSATEVLANPQTGLDAITTPVVTPAATPAPAKPRPRAKPTRAQRYSEDLSDLLQRR